MIIMFCKEIIFYISESEDAIFSSEMAIAASIVGLPIAVAAIAPPPLPMFPPQGVPQPSVGGGSGGGGAIPSSVVGVMFYRYLYSML